MSEPADAMTLPPDVEDCEVAIVHSLALFTAAADRLTTAGYTITNPSACRRPKLTGAREAVLAIRDAQSRLGQLSSELTDLIRRLDPLSEMLPEGQA